VASPFAIIERRSFAPGYAAGNHVPSSPLPHRAAVSGSRPANNYSNINVIIVAKCSMLSNKHGVATLQSLTIPI
jgi:hypothetical protein